MKLPKKYSLGGILVALLVLAVLGIGGFAAVQAAIPDANSQINACYRIKGGDLRVLDTASGDACSNQEMPISWGQQTTGYGRVVFAQEENNPLGGTYALDELRTKNITSLQVTDTGLLCITATFTPKNVVLTLDGQNTAPLVSVKDEHGWTSNAVDKTPCDAIAGANNCHGGASI